MGEVSFNFNKEARSKVGENPMRRSMKKDRLNVAVVSLIITKVSIIFLSNLVDILCSFSDNVYVIAGCGGDILTGIQKGHIYGVRHEKGANVFSRVMNYIYLELRISYKLVKLSKDIDLLVFFKGGEVLLLSMLTAKLLKKDVVIALVGYTQKEMKIKKDIFTNIVSFLVQISYTLANKIILYSPGLIKEWNLEKYKNKICIAHEHFLDFGKFKIRKQVDERENLVGYIGRLSEEKGAINFAKAVPVILKERKDLEFLIGGDGPLFGEIKNKLRNNGSYDRVELTGWIPHDELPNYLNELKLLVLPSYIEGIPNIMLEAMACRTPVLATSVGAIPDVIKDGETGFIMEDNLPECIAKNVIRALNYPNLDEIVKNACKLVEEEYTYEATIDRYRKILEFRRS